MVECIIDGRTVAADEGMTVLETARQAGLFIPTLCYLKALGPNRSCRLCIVEAQGPTFGPMVLASCDLKVSEGLVVRTATPLIQTIRKTLLQLLLASMPDNASVRAMAKGLAVESTVFAGQVARDACVLCGICIKACREKLGVSALRFAAEKGQAGKVAESVVLDGNLCIGCGACATLCPAGAIGFQDRGGGREMSIYGEVVQRLELVACATCHRPFTTRRIVAYLDTRLEGTVPCVPRVHCPECARSTYAATLIAEQQLRQTGEKA